MELYYVSDGTEQLWFTSSISRLGECFRDGQYSLVTFLFFVLLLSVPPCPVICKSEGTCPRALWRWRHFRWDSFTPNEHYKTVMQLNAQCHKQCSNYGGARGGPAPLVR